MKRNHNPIQIMDAITTKDTRVQHRSKGSTPLSNTNPHLVHTNKQQYSLHQGLGQHYEETITVNATSHTPISPGTTIKSSNGSSDNKLEETTIHDNRQKTQLDTPTKSVNEYITNAEENGPHNVKNTSKDVENMPVIKNTTHYTPTPTVITISSSEDGLENDREETNIRENQSEMSKPHLKPGEPQNTITIDGRDKSSHQEITILENDNRVSTLNDDTKFSVDLAQINNILANFLADTVQKMPWTPQQASANFMPRGNILANPLAGITSRPGQGTR
jgi:hypothetical protein